MLLLLFGGVEALCLFALWSGTNLAADSLGVGMYMGATDPAVVYFRAVGRWDVVPEWRGACRTCTAACFVAFLESCIRHACNSMADGSC